MKTIYLQRQGSSYTFNTNNAINSHWGYYVEVETLPGNRYAIRISHTVRETDGKNKTKTINIDARFPSLSDAFRRIEQEFREEYGEDIRIADTIEMYCHNNFTYRKRTIDTSFPASTRNRPKRYGCIRRIIASYRSGTRVRKTIFRWTPRPPVTCPYWRNRPSSTKRNGAGRAMPTSRRTFSASVSHGLSAKQSKSRTMNGLSTLPTH